MTLAYLPACCAETDKLPKARSGDLFSAYVPALPTLSLPQADVNGNNHSIKFDFDTSCETHAKQTWSLTLWGAVPVSVDVTECVNGPEEQADQQSA